MPTYEYICDDCGHELEAFQSMTAEPLKECPTCEQTSLRRKIGRGAGIIFKGGGFYETDFKDKKGTKPADEGGSSNSSTKTADAGKATEGKKESKPDAKTDSKPAEKPASTS